MRIFLLGTLILSGCVNAPFDRTYSLSFVDQNGSAVSASATFGAARVIKLPKPTKK